jgi:hypothetical protein
MVIDEDLPSPPNVAEMESWNHFSHLLTALMEATHPSDESEDAFSDALNSLLKLTEAHAGARLVNGMGADSFLQLPLSDPGIRNLIRGLLDVASYSSVRKEEFRELRVLLQSFESVPF